MLYIIKLLSESVSKAVELIGGAEASETARFLLMFDKLFDSLNVSTFSEGCQSRKPFRQPYHSADDFQLKVRTVCVFCTVLCSITIL